ncbi:hypothetical protein JY651_35385 [Pyxidicoccus parkwayensis]|uniref:ADYC domain-containing protein n=1 Tax=Pyxidicoccus parkwayensis TaxID=2813578 RepID=A0ABX7NP81_9BACT|nr:ADYC domain-containing protein [Pyxidicoccus parkwaysis]QSQ20493.1 hypothetical protein JY651_35385 [Pyxidicoccus parkwaysis]
MRRFTGPALGAWVVMSGGLFVSAARAEPPPQSAQGAWYHGTGTVETEHVNLWLEPTFQPNNCKSVTLETGGFRALSPKNCRPEDFTGSVFTSQDGTWTFEVSTVRPHRNRYAGCTNHGIELTDEAWEYTVLVSRKGSRPEPLCPGDNAALAVPLSWQKGFSSRGWMVHPSTDTFTFACIPQPTTKTCQFTGGGVIAKCTDWGYPPWKHTGQTLTGQLLEGKTVAEYVLQGNLDEAMSFHQACLRMATADYCGEGRPNTLNGTPIAFYDTKYVPLDSSPPPTPGGAPIRANLPAPPDEDFFFEAAWVDCRGLTKPLPLSGCDTADKLRAGFGAVCLSKRRWASLPVTGTCLDPQAPQEQPLPDLLAKPCEDYTEAELEALGARFFSFSHYLDTGLYRFTRPDGARDSITTTRYVLPQNMPGPIPVSLDPTLGASGTYAFARLEGAILDRKTSEALKDTMELRPLFRCVAQTPQGPRYLLNVGTEAEPEKACDVLPGSQLDTLSGKALEGYVSLQREGFLNTQLSLWRDENGNPVTATAPPKGVTWELLWPLGFIPGNR